MVDHARWPADVDAVPASLGYSPRAGSLFLAGPNRAGAAASAPVSSPSLSILFTLVVVVCRIAAGGYAICESATLLAPTTGARSCRNS